MLALVFVAPAAARAGCGDHVPIRPRDKTLSSPALAGESVPPPLAPMPCKGPNCSRSPRHFPSTPSSPSPSPDDSRWGLVNPHLDLSGFPGGIGCPDAFLAHPLHRPYRIERPPRPAAAL